MSSHILPKRVYYTIFAILLFCTYLTVQISFLHLAAHRRIAQRALPLDGRFVPTGDGAGVHVYVIDTGVRRSHREFDGRADWIGDFTTGAGDRLGTANADDCDPGTSPGRGHGTHVASIIG